MVICLLIVVALMVMPRFTGIIESVKLKADARQIAWFLKNLRYQAITEGKDKTIYFYNFDTIYKSGGKVYRLSPGISYERVTFNNIGITGTRGCRFNSSGTPTQGGTVGLENQQGDKIYVIVSTVAGRIRISDTPPP